MEPEQSLPALVEEEDEEEAYDKFRIFSTLTQFQVKIFRGEPKLVSLKTSVEMVDPFLLCDCEIHSSSCPMCRIRLIQSLMISAN